LGKTAAEIDPRVKGYQNILRDNESLVSTFFVLVKKKINKKSLSVNLGQF